MSHVLNREYTDARFALSDVDAKREVGVLKREWGEMSQFHQGAGEDATLDLFRIVQGLPNHSLLIVDEVEASLHPKAQRRLTRFLIWLSRQKRIQVLLSTHSPYVLEELPQEARILLLPGVTGLNVVYGATPEFALSRLDDDVHPDVNVFVEDREAQIWLREILSSHAETRDAISRIQITAVGPGNVVQIMGRLSSEKKLPYKSLAFIDGDYENLGVCISLPGAEAPERVVYSALKAKNWVGLPPRFGIGAGDLFTALDDAMLEPDHHKWNSMVGDRTMKSSTSVWETLCAEWCANCLEKVDRIRIHAAINELIQGTEKTPFK